MLTGFCCLILTTVIALLIKNFLSDDSEIVELGIDVAVSMTNLKSEQVSY